MSAPPSRSGSKEKPAAPAAKKEDEDSEDGAMSKEEAEALLLG